MNAFQNGFYPYTDDLFQPKPSNVDLIAEKSMKWYVKFKPPIKPNLEHLKYDHLQKLTEIFENRYGFVDKNIPAFQEF